MPTCAHLPSLEEAWGVTGRRLCCPPAVPRGRRRARTVLLFSSSSQLPPQELARVLAVRTPAQGPAHSTRSGLHVDQARTAGCPPCMHCPRTRRAARGLLRGPPRTALTAHGRRERGTSKPVVVSVDGKMDAPARIGGVEGRRQCLGKGAGGGGLTSGESTPVRSDPPTLRLHPRALSRSALGTSQLLPVHTEVGPGVKSWCRQF